MTGPLPMEIATVAGRIMLPAAREGSIPAHVTGELHRVLAWWQSVSAGLEPVASVVESAEFDDAESAVVAGIDAAGRAVDSGATLLIPHAVKRDETTARTLVALLTRTDSAAVVPQPEGTPDRVWMATVAAIRDHGYRLAELRGDPLALLEGAPDIAFVVGVLIGAAARQTGCIVDGTDECAAALVADRTSSRAKAWWLSGAQSPDPARLAAGERVDLTPGFPLGLSDETGFGAEATLALLRLLTT